MSSTINLAVIRKDYALHELTEEKVFGNPFAQLELWLQEAINAQVNEPNAMVLSTIKYDGKPSSRVVLLKGLTEKGLVFFTNYNSNKGKQLQSNPYASVVFFWPELQRQIRVEGEVEKIPESDSDTYFKSRPIESQIGAIASPQSEVIGSRKDLEEHFEKLKQLYLAEPIIRPQHWGGYLLKPTCFEFWQGRPSRLHDRIFFEVKENNSWKISRLAP
ncbi:MAG: pyridoxamine 5'-phosphate oxidase [Bacteroidia bacterium]